MPSAARTPGQRGSVQMLLPVVSLAAWALLASPALATGPPELEVVARYPREATGTMHFAERLSLRIGTATPLVLDEGWEELVPLPGPHYRVADNRFVLLGRTSTGAGMQTLHALSLAVRQGAVVLAARLTQTTDRPSSMWLVRSGATGALRLGIPEPPDDYVHNREDWRLFATPGVDRGMDFEGLKDLPFEDVTPQQGDLVYPPPFQRGTSPSRAAWVSVAPSGEFVLPPRAPTPAALVRWLYRSHQPWRGDDIMYEGDALDEASLLRFLDAPLVQSLRLDDECKARTQSVGAVDFDPFLAAQDYDDEGISELAVRCEVAGAQATCAVRFLGLPSDPASTRRLTYRLARRPEGWRVTDISWDGRQQTLGEALSRPCKN